MVRIERVDVAERSRKDVRNMLLARSLLVMACIKQGLLIGKDKKQWRNSNRYRRKSFFERMFKTTLADEEFVELRQLKNLAPGDFRTVRQEQFYLGGEVTNADRLAALKEECALKKDGDHSCPIGFAA